MHKVLQERANDSGFQASKKCLNTDKPLLKILKIQLHRVDMENGKNKSKKLFKRVSGTNKLKLINNANKPHQCDIMCVECVYMKPELKIKLVRVALDDGEGKLKERHAQDNADRFNKRRNKQCDVCKKMFSQASHLNAHKLIHNGLKPHKCNVCQKSFTQICNLKTHQLTHSKVKSHQCDICQKCFIQAAHLNTHKQRHRGEKPHQCHICQKCFTSLTELNRHKTSHTGPKSYNCNVCKKVLSELAI